MTEKALAESPKLDLASTDMPMSIEDAKNLMDSYQKLCAALLVPWEARIIKDGVLVKDSDYQRIKVKTKDEKGLDIWIERDFVKKSGWRKLATALRLNLEIVSKAREDKAEGIFVYRYEVKVTSPGGRSISGVGKCSSLEAHTKGREENDVEATAYTRAANRAISDLIGFGQTSAEELEEPPRKIVESEAEVKPPEQPAYKPRRFENLNPAPNGNEQEPIGLWQGIFKEAGFSEKEVSENVELEVLDNYRIAIHQKASFMPENLWKRFMQVVNDQRGIWNKDKRQWEGPC